MKIPSSCQIRAIDAYTIEHEPVSSVGLMQRAGAAVADWLLRHAECGTSFKVFAGGGNNGGDALYVAHLLALAGRDVLCYLFNYAQKLSPDCAFHKELTAGNGRLRFEEITEPGFLPEIHPDDWVVDGLFGTGLNRPLEEPFVSLIRHINASGATIVSIDIPSGLFGEDNCGNHPENCIHATTTLTFQFPKRAFMFGENSLLVGDWEILPIGLHPQAITQCSPAYSLVEKEDVASWLKPRGKFAHKGNFGHALLVGGSVGKTGAMVLAARAALRSGVGLLTVHLPKAGNDILQIAVPEAMTQPDDRDDRVTAFEVSGKTSAVGIGCGMGTSLETQQALYNFLSDNEKPLVVDADGLNILSKHPEWLSLLKNNTILTPHPLEFDRLVEASLSAFDRLEKAREFACRYNVVVVLKGAYTAVVNNAGEVSFNSTGNPGMATAGSGDALTGVLVALLAQGYDAFTAAKLGVYIHGMAGDIAARKLAFESITAGEIIDNLGNAFKELKM